MKVLLYRIMSHVKDILNESGLLPSYKVREKLAARHLKGAGLEIGALHLPLKVPAGVSVKYVDLSSREENISRFPELNAERIVVTDYLENGFELSGIPDNSQDFIIANHVLEHASNPFQVLLNWGRILKGGGRVFVTVPLVEKCFDRGRALTPLAHFDNDYRLCREGKFEEFTRCNSLHYREWLTISEPNIMSDRGLDSQPLPEGDMDKRIIELLDSSAEIHFHTFSEVSFAAFLNHFALHIDNSFELLEITKSRGGGECVAILGKLCP